MAVNINFVGTNGTALATYDSNFFKVNGAGAIANAVLLDNALDYPSYSDLLIGYTGEATDDVEIEIKAVTSVMQRDVGPMVRGSSSTNNGYALIFESSSGTDYTTVAVYRNGVRLGASASGTWDATVAISMRIVATVNGPNVDIDGYINDVLVISRTDASPVAVGTDGIRLHNGSTGTHRINTFITGGGSALTIDVEPSESRINSQSSFTVSGAATAPTTLNTTIALEVAGPTIVPDSVTGTDPWVINYTPPKTLNKLFNSTGYVHEITIDAETAESGIIPYLPETDWDFVTLGTVDTGTDIYTEYAGSTWVSGDQAVWDTLSTPDGATVSIDNTLNWDISPAPTSNQTVGIYRIAANDTKDVDDTITFVSGIPAESRGSVNQIAYYLMSTGNYSSTQVNDIIKEWLTEEGYVGALNDMLNKYLGDAGYTGTIQDRMIKWSKDV